MSGGSGLAVFAVPAWIRGAFAQQEARSKTQGEGLGPDTLERALERATAIGKPLMAIVVPEESLRLQRGRLWGDLFAFAPEEAMADFALCEWACAPVADLEGALPKSKAKFSPETTAVLFETDGSSPRTQLLAFTLGELEPQSRGGFPVREMQDRAYQLARILQKAILPDADAWKRRWQQSLRSGSTAEGDFALVLEDGIRPRLEAVDRHAGIARGNAELFPTQRGRYIAALAQAAARRLWDAEPAGAAWKTEHVDPCPPCGMGMIGGASRAFLEFYVSKPR